MSIQFRKIILSIAAAALLTGSLSACREEEQGRPLSYEKGIYGGTVDEPLSQEQLRALIRRGGYQGL